MIMVLAPPKVVLRSRPEEWAAATGGAAALVTGEAGFTPEIAAEYASAFATIELFPRYTHNDLVVIRAAQLLAEGDFVAVVPLSEIDVLRAAALRERCGLDGLGRMRSRLFRDKIAMKKRLTEHGIAVAPHRRVTDALELLDFVDEHGYPVVLKPVAGRGSALTSILRTRSELDALLDTGILTGTDRLPDMLVEAFVPGELHHIDGMYVEGECRFMSAARYIGSHVGYRDGGYLGSIVLDEQSRMARQLTALTRTALEDALGIGREGLFHVEIFADGEDLVFNEAAIRMAGSPINEEIQQSYGLDLKLSFVQSIAARATHVVAPQGPWPQLGYAGQLVISPRPGHLRAIPEQCPFPWVVEYRHGQAGRDYSLMSYTNNEVASFVVAGDDEAHVAERLGVARAWFANNTEWEEEP